jgi:hypothetical protein
MEVFPVELRREVARRARRVERSRYPTDLKARVSACAVQARRRGYGWAVISARLGVPAYCLRRWTAVWAPKFRKVDIEPDRSAAVGSGAVVVLASGVRVEGLDAAGVALLLRSLS